MEKPENLGNSRLEQKIKELRVINSFTEADPGMNLDPELRSRFVLLEGSEINKDSRDIEIGGRNILRKIADKNPEYSLTEKQFAEFNMAALLHDVGKTGGPEATLNQKLAIVKVFSFRGEVDLKQKVADVVADMVKEKFVDRQEAINIISNIGQFVDITNMSMMDFYNCHAKWGSEILSQQRFHVPEIIQKIAILHHLDKKDNDYSFGVELGNNPTDIIRQRVLMIMDQYQAYVCRSGMSHTEAIKRVKEDPSKNLRDDPYVVLILDRMSKMTQKEIFNGIIK